jgi:hypothetical protein
MENLNTAGTFAAEEVLLEIILSLHSGRCSFDVTYRYLTRPTFTRMREE